jgi:glutamate-1-semialdehyde 2,1-aminomutase
MTSNAEMLSREFVIERGAGIKVYDVEGREYLDFVLGSGPRVRS